eukprot:2673433-Rhodomonas_salina.2
MGCIACTQRSPTSRAPASVPEVCQPDQHPGGWVLMRVKVAWGERVRGGKEGKEPCGGVALPPLPGGV